jgi:hypothetical protein
MKIYIAATAPGNESCRERGMLDTPRRLLSYFLIKMKPFEDDKVFATIVKENRNEN